MFPDDYYKDKEENKDSKWLKQVKDVFSTTSTSLSTFGEAITLTKESLAGLGASLHDFDTATMGSLTYFDTTMTGSPDVEIVTKSLKVKNVLRTEKGLILLYPDGTIQAIRNEDIKDL